MRILVTIPHFFDPDRESPTGRRHGSRCSAADSRAAALTACIQALHQLYGRAQYMMQLVHRRTSPANAGLTADVDVVVCTTGEKHLLARIPVDSTLYDRHATAAEPLLLGFECQALMRERWGAYDYYCYLEDDLILHDPWLFLKLAWFGRHVGDDKLLLPNRFECGTRPLVTKAYIDGDLAERVAAPFQNVGDEPELRGQMAGREWLFRRPLNPHSGCYFLNAGQMADWMRQPHFLDRDTSFVGPLESAATLGIMRAFKLYKPAPENASFLEIEHSGSGFLSQLRRPP